MEVEVKLVILKEDIRFIFRWKKEGNEGKWGLFDKEYNSGSYI